MFGFMDKLALNNGLMLLLCSITLAFICAELCIAIKRGKLQARGVINATCKAIVTVAAAVLAGFLISLLPLEGVWASVVYCATLLLVLGVVVLIYIAGERKIVRAATANALRKSAGTTAAVRYAKGWLYGACFSLMIVAAVLLAIREQNFFVPMIPVAVFAVCQLLHGLLPWRIWYALATLAALAFFIYVLYFDIIAPNLLSLVTDAPATALAAMLTAAGITLSIRK